MHRFDRYYPYYEASEKLVKFHRSPEIIANRSQIFSGMNTQKMLFPLHFSSPPSSTIRSLPTSALLCAPEACFLWTAASAFCGDGKHQLWLKRWCFSCTHPVSTALAAFLWPISRASALIDSVNTVPFPVLVFFRPIIILASINPFSSVQFYRSVVSDSLRPHGLKHARPPCPLPTPGIYSNPCPLSWWCHPMISSPSPPAFSLSQHQGLF